MGNSRYVLNSERKITELGLQKSSAQILPEGTLLYTSRAGIGNTAILCTPATTNQGFQSIIPIKNKLDSYFIYSLSGLLKRYGNKMGSGSTFIEISGKQLSRMHLYIPDFSEQKKIAKMIKTVDDLSALYQRKNELIVGLKMSLLQKIYPANPNCNSIINEINNNKAVWEWKPLDDVVIKQIKGSLKLSDIQQSGNTEYLDANRLNGGKPQLSTMSANVSKNDILILWDGSNAGQVFTGVDGVLGSTLKSYRLSVDHNYIYQFLHYNEKNIMDNYRTPNIPHVQKDFLTIFQIPTTSEFLQIRIGTLFSKIDDILCDNKKSITQLKLLKKLLLQKLFI